MSLIVGQSPKLVGIHRPGIKLVGYKTYDIAGSTGNSNVSLTDLTAILDTQPREGDVVIVGFMFNNSSNFDLTIGPSFTEVADLYLNDTYKGNFAVAWKLMTSSPDTLFTVSSSGGADRKIGCVQVWRGVNPTTSMDVAAVTATGTNSLRPNPPSITPVTPGAIVVAVGAGVAQTGLTYTSPDLNDFIGEYDSSGWSTHMGMGWIGPWVSGAVDPAQFNLSGGDNVAWAWGACTLALRPA